MRRNISSLLLLLSLVLLSYTTAADTCPSGMRKLYLDDQSALAYGAARNEIPAVTFYEGNGALWYNRKVLIEPRFEIHLKVDLKKVNIIQSTDEQILEGFTMVISGVNNKVGSGTPENIGYSGFTKSFIMEFDFNRNSFDPDANSYSLRYCASDCSADDAKAIFKGRLSYQRYDPTKDMTWDFRLIYSDGKLKVYSGPNDILYEYPVDLAAKIGSTLGYVGFTGYQRGNRRELNLYGTFICEDNYDLSRMKGNFVVDGKQLETATYKAGNKIYYSFSFKNNRGELVPHCFKTNVWNYDFSLSVDCQTNGIISVVDEYTLLFTLDACEAIGRHPIGLKELNHGNGQTSYYETIPNGLEKITLIGHDGIIGDIEQQIDGSNQARILKYGTTPSKDFTYKSGLTFVFDFDMTDIAGNKVKIGETSDNMLSTSRLSLVNTQFARYSMKEYGDHYQFILTVSKPGVYQIASDRYMEESYEVIVVEGEVDNQKSYCTLDGYSTSPTLKKGEKVTLKCYLSDSFGNQISYTKFRDNSAYDFSCNVERTSPTSGTFYSSPKESDGNIACEYITDEAGQYKFKGYLNIKKSTIKNEITPKINSFSVQVADLSLVGAKVYDPYSSSWEDINVVTLTYKPDSTGFFTALDLTDSTHTILMSSLGTLPKGFDVSSVTAVLSAAHDTYFTFGELKTKVISISGKQYVGVYTADGRKTDDLIKKSSFNYRIQLQIKTERKNVPLVYRFEQPHTVGNQITCFHELDISNTIVGFETISLLKNGGQEYLGEVQLQTKDNYLYNYDIGKQFIELRAKGMTGFSYNIIPDTILGIYQVYAWTTEDLKGDIELLIKGTVVKTFTSASQKLKESCTMRLLHPEYVEFSHNDDIYNYWYNWVGGLTESGNLRFQFQLFDRYGNLITEPNFRSTFTDIYSHAYGMDENKYIPVTYDYVTQSYIFQDRYIDYGRKMEWVFFCRDYTCNNKTIITYTNGQVDFTKSYFTIVRSEISEGEYAYVDVVLRDANGQNIGQDRNTLLNFKNTIIVSAAGPERFTFIFDQITGQLALRYKYKCNREGQYIVSATYTNRQINSNNKMLNVISSSIDVDASIVQMIIDRTIELSVNREETVDNSVHIPFYRLFLYTIDGDRLEFDNSLDVTAVFSDANGNEWNLLVNKASGTYIQFTYDANTKKDFPNFLRGHYILTINVAGTPLKYKIYLVGNGEDGSNAKEYDNSKTEYSTLHIYGEAGITYPVNVEFRDTEGLRWNTKIDVNLFKVTNSYNLGSDKLSVTFQEGSKNGQFIINIIQKQTTTPGKDNLLTITYNGKELNKKIALTIYSSKLFKLTYDSGLKDGTVENLPIIKLIPVDKYGNVCQDIFDSTKTNQAKINSLTIGRSLDGVLLTTNNYLSENKYLNVQYKTNVPTTISVTSQYYDNEPVLTYKILAGDVDPDKTFAQLLTSGANTAGGTYVIMIYPRDKSDNEISLTPEDLAKFQVTYDVDGANEHDISKVCELVEGNSNSFDIEVVRRLATEEKNFNQIKCSTPITTAGTIEFHVNHVKDEVECRFCIVSIVANEIDFTKTKAIYVNKNYVMDEKIPNPTESKILPTWKLIFRDKYSNEIHDSEITEKLNVSSFLGSVKIRLCVTDSSYTKLINVCKDENGDDNQNKWYYLTNGNSYTLNVTETKLGKLGYPLSITGNDYGNGKCTYGDVDLSKTKFNPTKLTLRAGQQGTSIMTLYTTGGTCWNYWYPNINNVIKVTFDSDQDTCESQVTKGDVPSEYKIIVSCKKKNNNNGFKVSVNGVTISTRVQLVINAGYSYYLAASNPELFNVAGLTHVFKKNPTNDETIKFSFKLYDKFMNVLDYPTLPESKTDVSSERYGANTYYWEAAYVPSSFNYAFTDKIKVGSIKNSWYFTCRESGFRYIFTYTKIPGIQNSLKSTYTVDKTTYYLQETSYVEITLKDQYGYNIADVVNNLMTEKDNIVVKATGTSSITYKFDSITDRKTIKFKYTFGTVGNYDISVLYKTQNIQPLKTSIRVIYPGINLDKTKLYINKNSQEILMNVNSPTTVNNTVEYPFFKLELYSSDGTKIENYDKSTNFTCLMGTVDYNWTLTTSKETNYVKFVYKITKEEYAQLPRGEYPLVVYINGSAKVYKLLLLGSAATNGYSPDPRYKIVLTEVTPSLITGIVGQKYSVKVTFKASDGLNWYANPNPNLVSISNSLQFSGRIFSYIVEIPKEKGQFIITFTQTKVSLASNPNKMIIYYNGEKIPTEVEIIMKNGELKKLVYVDGLRNGTVEDFPTLRFKPLDEYDNLVTEVFDATKYDRTKIQGLTKGTSVEGYTLVSNNFVSLQYVNVQYQSFKPTTIKVTSQYYTETYTYTLFASGIYADKTYAELIQKTNSIAGDPQNIMIYPKDKYGNEVEVLTETEKNKFIVTYTTPDNKKIDISNTCRVTDEYKASPLLRRLAAKNAYNKIQCTSSVIVAGSIEFHVDYVDDPVECRKCQTNIGSVEIDFSKTTSLYKNTNVNMSRTVATKVSAKELPTFVLTFYDKYWNLITDEKKVAELKVTTEMRKTDVDLCVSNSTYNKLSNVCDAKKENVDKWHYLVNGNSYKFVVSKNTEQIVFPVEIIDGYKTGSSEPLDYNKTYLNPTKLTLNAGVEGKINLELRTAQDVRKNFWFEDHNEKIKVKFAEDANFCKYSIIKGTEPGQYVIKVSCTKKRDNNKVIVTVDGHEVPQKVDLKIIAADPYSSKLYTLDDVEITKSDLGTVKVTEEYKIKEIFYDKYNNLITEINFNTDILEIKFGPTVAKKPDTIVGLTTTIQGGAVIITMKSTLAVKHKLIGKFFPLPEYYITFTHGPVSDKSILEVDKTVVKAGETVKAYIILYDVYGNRIDAHEFEKTNPFTVYYRPEGENTDTNIPDYKIEEMDGGSVITYPVVFTKAGITKVSGFINDAPLNTKEVTVLPSEMDFLKSKVYRYDPNLKEFEILKNGTIEKNNETDPIYRLFPVDTYGNDIEFIPEEILKKLVSYLNSLAERGVFYYFKLNNKETKEQGYAEFIKNDEDSKNQNTYKTLVGGFYDLIFTDGKDKLPYNITLGNSREGSNLPADIQNTYVFPDVIKIKAGEEGNVFVQIRTASNTTKSVWDGYKIKIESCDKTDTTFKYVEQGAGSIGTFLVTVTSKKANTYPTIQKCPLNIYVNDELVKNQHPLIEVYPGEPYRSAILEKYWKDPKSCEVLVDGNADSSYVFEVKSFDKYDNLCETKQETVGISVSLLGNDVETTSDNVVSTGYRKYVVSTSVAGVYTITSKFNSATNKQYLPNDSIFNIYPGEIDLTKVIVQEVENVIKAGEKPGVSVIAFDKHGNSIKGVNLQDKFDVIFTDAGGKTHTTTNAINEKNKDQVIYTSATAVTIIGYVKPTVTYKTKSQLIDTTHINILVVAAEPEPKNSLLSRLTTSGTVTVYKNGDRIPCNVDLPPVFNITLYDKYNNYISTIPSDVNVVKPTMSGKSMTPIIFGVENKVSFYNLDFNKDAKSLKIYSRLVRGDYDFTYDIKTVSATASFKYTIELESDGDEYHGNGAFDRLIITPTNKTFYAGDYEYFTLELRTKELLLYNDEVAIKEIEVKLNVTEQSFKYEINPTGILGNYTLSIYCEKKGRYKFNAKLNGLTSNDVTFRVKPQLLPHTPFTQIITQPAEEITPEDKIEIVFKLADKFNNTFEEREDIIEYDYLIVTNNNQSVPVAEKELLKDGETFKVKLDPIYPPLTMSINTIYNDGEHTIPCFLEDILVKIITPLDVNSTVVKSENAISIYVGEILDMRLYTYDSFGFCKEEEDYSELFKVIVNGPLDTKFDHEKIYKVHKVHNNETGGCQNKYEIITTEDDIYTKTGLYNITVVGETTTIAHFEQTALTTGYAKFDLEYVDPNFDPDNIIAGDTVDFIIKGYDKYRNLVNEPLKDDLNITLTKDGKDAIYNISDVEIISGEVTYHATVYNTGKLQMHLFYKGDEVTVVNDTQPLPIWTVSAGPCVALENNENFDLTNFTEDRTITLNRYQYFRFKCYDQFRNEINKGGEQFTSSMIYNDEFGHMSPISSSVVDNGDGYYYVKFIPESYGKHVANIKIYGRNEYEKYGDEITINLKTKECFNGQILCPNKDECVSRLVDCILPPNDCPSDKPFKLPVNGVETCVASQTYGDCPSRYFKCESVLSNSTNRIYWPGYCVPIDAPHMCPTTKYTQKKCKFENPNFELQIDGKCREKDQSPPSWRKCPMGKVLCGDFSCRDNYDQCKVYEPCPLNYYRCADQTCVSDSVQCPNLLTCADNDKVVCNDEKCYDNELYCPATNYCEGAFSFLCGNNACALKSENCGRLVSCKNGESLCSDNICRKQCTTSK